MTFAGTKAERVKEFSMAIDEIFGSTINLLAKNLELRARNHMYIAGNIAHVETPNYVPKTLSFEKELKDVVQKKEKGSNGLHLMNPRHIPLKGMAGRVDDVQGSLESTPAKSTGLDGNGVDLDREMGRMAENQILYNASVQILSKKFEGLKTAIKGGM
jgi:flagellar basal-body rod protein FlgB